MQRLATGPLIAMEPLPEHGRVVVGLNAVIMAVTDEVPRIMIVRRADHELATPAQRGEEGVSNLDALPFGPFAPDTHPTLEQGLRRWVTQQTGLTLGHVEQLYTFADRYRDPSEVAGGPRVVSIGYLALVRQGLPSGTGLAEWRSCYDFLPWEDWRYGRPALLDTCILPQVSQWVAAPTDGAGRSGRLERAAITFGLDDATWNAERVLDRYELLYEMGFVVEAQEDQRARETHANVRDPTNKIRSLDQDAGGIARPMALDHRRILATALGRLRGKLPYRPVIFELLPPTFTLLHMQRTAESLIGTALHKQNFRRLVVSGGLVEETGTVESRTGGRPAKLFRFRRDVLRERPAPGVGLRGGRPPA